MRSISRFVALATLAASSASADVKLVPRATATKTKSTSFTPPPATPSPAPLPAATLTQLRTDLVRKLRRPPVADAVRSLTAERMHLASPYAGFELWAATFVYPNYPPHFAATEAAPKPTTVEIFRALERGAAGAYFTGLTKNGYYLLDCTVSAQPDASLGDFYVAKVWDGPGETAETKQTPTNSHVVFGFKAVSTAAMITLRSSQPWMLHRCDLHPA